MTQEIAFWNGYKPHLPKPLLMGLRYWIAERLMGISRFFMRNAIARSPASVGVTPESISLSLDYSGET
ncbi:MAG: hypothetical protein VKJ46_01180 [Leptolyngbyaceae bacterium]|nr:hypothetical protein [Leptolyngbyaceae bacterium]